MSHGYYGAYNKHMTIVLGHWKFTTNKPLTLWTQGLSVVNFPDLGLRLYVWCINLIPVVYIINISTAPRDLSVDNVTDTTVTLKWMIPAMYSEDITGYNLKYKPKLPCSQQKVDSMTYSCIVTGLSPDTEYELSVAAVTVQGCEEHSDNIQYTTSTSKFSGTLYVCF